MNAIVLLRIVLIFSLTKIFLDPLVTSGQNNLSGPTNAVKQLVENPKLKGAQIGVAVLDMKNGKLIASHQEDKLFIPASTQKLITTAAAAELRRLLGLGGGHAGRIHGSSWSWQRNAGGFTSFPAWYSAHPHRRHLPSERGAGHRARQASPAVHGCGRVRPGHGHQCDGPRSAHP